MKNPIIKRTLFIALVILFIIILNCVYKDFVTKYYSYMGFDYNNNLDTFNIFISWLLALLPALWMPIKIRRPSQLIYIVFYLTIYIPPLFLMYNFRLPTLAPKDILILNIVLFFGIISLGLEYLLPLIKVKYHPIKKNIFIMVGSIISFIFIAYVITTQFQNLHFATSISEIYQIRADYKTRLLNNSSSLTSYAISWIAYVIVPFLFSFGLFFKKKGLIFTGITVSLLIYAINGFKALLFLPVLIFVINYLIKRWKSEFSIMLVLGFSGLLLIPYLGTLFNFNENLMISIINVIPFRIFSVPAYILMEYYDFFTRFPPTYLSHVSIFSLFIKYPYQQYLSSLIPIFYNGYGSGANASAWAMDGLAGFGLFGIVIISIFMGLVFLILDSSAKIYRVEFVVLCIVPTVINVTSTSIFTNLFSGGLILIILLFLVIPQSNYFSKIFRNT